MENNNKNNLKILFSKNIIRYWFIIILILISSSAILFISEKKELQVFRYIISIYLLFYIPGYSFRKAFIIKIEFSELERLTFDVTLSLFIIPFIGFILNYTPWGITITSSILGITVLSISLLIINIFRQIIYNKYNIEKAL